MRKPECPKCGSHNLEDTTTDKTEENYLILDDNDEAHAHWYCCSCEATWREYFKIKFERIEVDGIPPQK